MQSIARAVLLTAILTLGGCSDTGTDPDPIDQLPRALSVGEQRLIAAGNQFAVDLLGEVHRASPDSTVFLSPLSASMALGMTMNGTAGATLEQMRQTLGFGAAPLAEIDASYHDLIALLRSLDPQVDLRLANALFYRNGFQIEQPFLDVAKTSFDARIQALDFANAGAAGTINAWVKSATGGRIEEIVQPPIDDLTMAYLINAIYFKGDWTEAFDSKLTAQAPFRLQNGTTRQVSLMETEQTLPFREGSGWVAAELPYGGGAWVMTVAVPTTDQGLARLVPDLAAILDPAAEWPERPVNLFLPKFELEWERVLNDDLIALGMVDAFHDGRADFTPMYRRAKEVGLHIKKVKQKTFLAIDEEGTEAAAVTSVEVGVTSAPPPPQVVRADRPFLLAIRERLSGTVLFAGLIVQAPGN